MTVPYECPTVEGRALGLLEAQLVEERARREAAEQQLTALREVVIAYREAYDAWMGARGYARVEYQRYEAAQLRLLMLVPLRRGAELEGAS